jgi:hypothetical protein
MQTFGIIGKIASLNSSQLHLRVCARCFLPHLDNVSLCIGVLSAILFRIMEALFSRGQVLLSDWMVENNR